MRERIQDPSHDPSTLEALRTMERRAVNNVQKWEERRQALRAEWKRNQELCMQVIN